MGYLMLYQTVLTILSSIITGGFVLVFVEIGNRKNRENDRHDIQMLPFIHKLSAYFRFISWCSSHINYPKPLNEKDRNFKQLTEKMSKYGGQIIMSGGDYLIDSFTAEELEQIALDINNIWYWHDKMRPCNLSWNNHTFDKELIDKDLKEINPKYLGLQYDVNLVAKVSGDFYVDIYQPIEYESYRHEAYLKLFSIHMWIVSIAVTIVLIILCLMLFLQMPSSFLQYSTLIIILLLLSSLMLLGIDIKKQVIWRNKILRIIKKQKKNQSQYRN